MMKSGYYKKAINRSNVALIFCILFIFPSTILFALKACPKCGSSFDEKVNYCPYDGSELKVQRKIEKGRLQLQILPVEGEVSLDGISRGKLASIALDLPTGEHKIEVSANGFSPQKFRFYIAPNQIYHLVVELFPLERNVVEDNSKAKLIQEKSEKKLSLADKTKDMVEIPAGSYLLGSERGNPDERPLRRVTTKGFFIDKYEVTCAQYQEFLDFVKENGHLYCHPNEPKNKDHTPYHTYAWALQFSWVGGRYPNGKENHPVVLVDWYDAYAYARWRGKRLPTEDEWEIAAGGGDGREYPWGNTFSTEKCAIGNSPVRVGSFPEGRSPWGCEDMAGNVAEWTATMYEPNPRDGKLFEGKFGHPIIRGGSWDDNAHACRVSARDVHRSPFYRSTTVGFRCVLDK